MQLALHIFDQESFTHYSVNLVCMSKKDCITSVLLYNVNPCTFGRFSFTYIDIKPVMRQ